MMMKYAPKYIPIELFPGDWCLMCLDPDHPDAICHMFEMRPQPDGGVAVEPCACDNNVTADTPGKYVVRVVKLQKE